MKARRFRFGFVRLAAAATAFYLVQGATAQAPELPIHAAGHWRSDVAGDGQWSANLVMHGDALSGDIMVDGRADLTGTRVMGRVSRNSVSGNTIQFDLAPTTGTATTFSGRAGMTAAEDGDLVGTYEVGAGDRGVWSGSWRMDATTAGPDWPPDVPIIPALPSPGGTEPWLSSAFLFASSPARLPMAGSDSPSGGSTEASIVDANSLVNNPDDAGAAENEPEIAINPANSQNIVAGAKDFSLAPPPIRRVGYYTSTDGGLTWPVRGEVPGLATFDITSDPVLDFDLGGRVFYAGVALDSYACDPLGATDNAIFVSRSQNGGQTFENAIQVGFGPAGGNVVNDKPWLAVDRVNGSPYKGNVYLAWTKIDVVGTSCTGRKIWLARSTTGSQPTMTFDSGRRVSDTSPAQGASLAITLNGKVAVAWWDMSSNPNRIRIDQCTSGGTNCGTDRTVADITPLPLLGLPGTAFRMNSLPSLAIDNWVGGNGIFYVVWADYRSNNADIYFTRSTDSTGITFLPAVPIAARAEDEFFPALRVDAYHWLRVLYYRRTSAERVCCGDCSTDGFPAQDGIVTATELQMCIDIVNGLRPLSDCSQCDCNSDGQVSAGEITSVTVNEQDGCGRFDVYEISSGDYGNTWSAPVQVNDGGDIAPTKFDDGGNIGDYIGMDAGIYRHEVWMDSRRLQPGSSAAHQQDVYTARISGGC